MPLFSLFSLFLWIDLLDNVISKRVKGPLLALAVGSIAYDFVELIDRFSTMEENWRGLGCRWWLEQVQEDDALVMG